MAEITAQQVTEERMSEGIVYPAGDYVGVISESDYGKTKAGDMERLSLTFQILDGPFSGKTYFMGFNLKSLVNDERKIQSANISWRQYNSLKDALGFSKNPGDSALLHNIPLILKLGVKKKKDSEDMENTIKGFKSATGSAPAPAQTGTAPAASAPAVDEKMPWIRK